MKCQECTGEDNRCDGTSDNGVSVECPDWATSCVFVSFYSGEEVYRACSLLEERCTNDDGVIIFIFSGYKLAKNLIPILFHFR